MVEFMCGRSTAHVMKLDRSEQWVSLCNKAVTGNPRDLGVADAEKQPPMPWCKACVRDIQKHVEALYATVLLPSASLAGK